MARRQLGKVPTAPADPATVGYVTQALAAAGRGGISLDTDGVPYFDPTGLGVLALDTDGVPYFSGV